MNVNAEKPAEGAVIPDDLGVATAKVIKTNAGDVTVKSLTLGGTMKVVAVMRKVGMKSIPAVLDVSDFLSDEQHAELRNADGLLAQAKLLSSFAETLTTDQRAMIRTGSQERIEAIFHWVMASEQLLPAALSAISDLTETQAMELRPVDMLNVLTAAIDLIDLPATVEAAMTFFTRTGGLMGEFGKQRAAALAGTSEGT